MKKHKVFCSWSGGKDCNLAFWKAKKQGFEVSYLLNMTSEDGSRSRSHGIKAKYLKKQAQALEVPIVQPRVSWEGYETEYKKAIIGLKEQGVEAGVFGDIDFMPHWDWVNRICKECGVKAYLPLWERKREDLLNEFIKEGFETVVVAVREKFLGKEWLGRKIDEKFIEDLKKVKGVDLSGEAGEYHTFVINGPIFRQRIELGDFEKIRRDDNWILDINP
ncbi:MAG: diphthine--ammonia ligase [Candidatus Omnitrophota bacterium]